jgi:hypothetical protein
VKVGYSDGVYKGSEDAGKAGKHGETKTSEHMRLKSL